MSYEEKPHTTLAPVLSILNVVSYIVHYFWKAATVWLVLCKISSGLQLQICERCSVACLFIFRCECSSNF